MTSVSESASDALPSATVAEATAADTFIREQFETPNPWKKRRLNRPSDEPLLASEQPQHDVDALLKEMERLRRENEELKLRPKTPAVAKPEEAVPQPRGCPSAIDIRSWQAGQLVLRPPPAETAQIIVAAEAISESADSFAANLPLGTPSWLGQPHFWSGGSLSSSFPRWDDSCDLQRSLLQAAHERSSKAFFEAFSTHVQRVDRPLLAFSAKMAPFFALLREGSSTLTALSQLASWLKGLIELSVFGDRPPESRPKGMTRMEFVRVCVTQAGISLDLARLGFAERRWQQQQGKKNEGDAEAPASQTILPIGDAAEDESTVPRSRSRSPRSSPQGSSVASSPRFQATRRAVSRSELDSALIRAGRFLAAVLMDMDILHDAATGAAGVASRAEGRSEAKELQPEKAAAALPLEDPFFSGCTLEQTFSASSTMAAWAAEGLPDQSYDPLNCPTFGEFLDKQLLPLAVGDLPWKFLRDLASAYCRVPLDSDDEGKAWKALGRNRPAESSAATARRLLKRQASAAQRQQQQAKDESHANDARVPSEELQTLSELARSTATKGAVKKDGALSGSAPLLTSKKILAAARSPAKRAAAAKQRPATGSSASHRESNSSSGSMLPPKTPFLRPNKQAFATPQVSAALFLSPNTQARSRRAAAVGITPVSWRQASLPASRTGTTPSTDPKKRLKWDCMDD